MANTFSEEEVVLFNEAVESFEDGLVLSHEVNKYQTEATMMARSGDQFWRTVPYISTSYDGTDATSNFAGDVQLSVPASISISKHATSILDAKERRDALREGTLGKAKLQKLASDINIAIMALAAEQSTVVVARTGAASGFDDVAEIDSTLNELGVPMEGRRFALSSRDYNGMASNLAARETINEMPSAAYKKAYVGDVAGFETYKMDYANSLTAAAGTTVTISGANQYYTPVSTVTTANGTNNVDNRYQTISIAVGGGTVKVGDAFTIAGVNSVHHITKEDTGELKTFRITEIVTGAGGSGTVKISPAIVSGQGATAGELQYKNVTATPADGAAITFLNTTTARVNPFWVKDALEILPGSYDVPTDAGAAVMKATTENGIEITMTKQYDIDTMNTKYRWDIFFGVVNKNPEMTGIEIFNQA